MNIYMGFNNFYFFYKFKKKKKKLFTLECYKV